MRKSILITLGAVLLLTSGYFAWTNNGADNDTWDTGLVSPKSLPEIGGSAISQFVSATLLPGVKKKDDPPPPPPIETEADVLTHCPASDGFAYPVGAPHGKGYRDVQPFGRNHHLGEDWNGARGKGGNGDLGHPIYTIAHGVVTYAEQVGKNCDHGWGNVVKVVHNAGTVDSPQFVESLYAHLEEVHVKKYQVVQRGDQVGTMGNCDGVYWAHLHFELRSEPFLPIGRGYAVDKSGYLDPKKFIERHRYNADESNENELFAGYPPPKPKKKKES